MANDGLVLMGLLDVLQQLQHATHRFWPELFPKL